MRASTIATLARSPSMWGSAICPILIALSAGATARPHPRSGNRILELVEEIAGCGRVTLGADKGYDRKEFIEELRKHQVNPHIACKVTGILDARTTRHPGYLRSGVSVAGRTERCPWFTAPAALRSARNR